MHVTYLLDGQLFAIELPSYADADWHCVPVSLGTRILERHPDLDETTVDLACEWAFTFFRGESNLDSFFLGELYARPREEHAK